MPLIDGLGFLRRLRSQDYQRSTPVAIVTGEGTMAIAAPTVDTTMANVRRRFIYVSGTRVYGSFVHRAAIFPGGSPPI